MARQLLRDVSETCRRIMDGELDGELDAIAQSVKARLKTRFRPNTRIRLVNTRNPELEGKEGVVLKVNPKRISVGIGEKVVEGEGTAFAYEKYTLGEFNVPPEMLELVA